MLCCGLGKRCDAGLVERKLCQLGHDAGDLRHRGCGVAIQAQQAFEHQLPSDPQGRAQLLTLCLQPRAQIGKDGRAGQARRQFVQLLGITPTDALGKTRIVGNLAQSKW